MIIPATCYRDCDAALDYLTGVFGLTEHAVHRDDDGRIVHAQLMHGGGMVMFGPVHDGEFGEFMIEPNQTGGKATTSIYVVARDVEERYDRAVLAGARVLVPLRAEEYGGKSFTVADPEGHIWSFGSYDPLAPNL